MLSVVCLPMFKVCQFKTACCAVWVIFTLVWPPLVVCVGVFAPLHVVTGFATPGPDNPLSGTSPPRMSPLGTLGNCCPGWFGSAPRLFGPLTARFRAAACIAFNDCRACVARARVSLALARACAVVAAVVPYTGTVPGG